MAELETAAVYDPTTSSLTWTVRDDRESAPADAVLFELETAVGRYTLVTDVRGTTATVPSLPPDFGPVISTSVLPLLASDSSYAARELGTTYHDVVSLLGARGDSSHPDLQLFTRTLTRELCEP